MKKRGWSLLCAMVFLLSVFTAKALETDSEFNYLIYYEQETDENLLLEFGGEILHEYKNISALLVKLSPGKVDLLKEQDGIKHIEFDAIENYENTLNGTENYYRNDDIQWGLTKVNAPLAWQNGYTGKGIKIAVLDSGISTNHKDLNVFGGASFVNYTDSYDDDNGHGTHVAGIIAASGKAATGVAPDAELYAVKVTNNEGKFFTSDLIKGIDWSINNKMDIINMSLKVAEDDYGLSQIITKAYENGILIVGATGNTGEDPKEDTVNFPAKYLEVIAVSAIDEENDRAKFSSFGSRNDIAAPGNYIYSTFRNNSYGWMSGTSMAAPHVTGILALMKEQYPDYTNVQLKEMLLQNAYDLGEPGWDPLFGYGLVNIKE